MHIIGALCCTISSAGALVTAFTLNKGLIAKIISANIGLLGMQMFGKSSLDKCEEIAENNRKIFINKYILEKIKNKQKSKTMKG